MPKMKPKTKELVDSQKFHFELLGRAIQVYACIWKDKDNLRAEITFVEQSMDRCPLEIEGCARWCEDRSCWVSFEQLMQERALELYEESL